MNHKENLPSNSYNLKGSVGRDLVVLLHRMDLETLKNERIAMLLPNKIKSKNCVQFENQQINRKALRPRQECNYNEISFDTSNKEIKSRINQNVPIYKQNKKSIDSDKNLNNPKIDLYEFNDFDSECNLRRKAKRSSMFDKTTYDILKKIENMEKIKSKVQKKNRQLRNKQKYNKKVQNIVSGVINKIKSNRTEKIATLSDDKHAYHLNNINAEPKDIQNVVSATSKDVILDCAVHSKIENKSLHGNEILNKPQNDDENYFGFEVDNDHRSVNPKKKKVNVVSNVLVRGANSPAAFEPNANSTMCNESSPWRFQPVNLRRNPYLLKLKESSLPSLDQDAVLEHTVEEQMSLKQNTHNELVAAVKQPSSVQKNLLDYFEHENNENKENIYPQGLFDYNEANSSAKAMTQRNLRHRFLQSTPRSSLPLGPIIIKDNTDNTKEQEIKSKRLTYFGFDISSDLVQNSELPKSDGTRLESSKPFRCNLNKIVKQYGSKSKIRRIQQNSEEKDIDTVPGLPTDTECVQGASEAQLFEDPDDINKYKVELPSPIVVEKKKRLRKHSSSKDENCETKRCKKKNLASRAEEEELEKWAAAFNSTCAEIEKHELEIE